MILGRYEVVRELGKGAMGVVYLAKDPLIGRLVALKTIRTVGAADEEEAREYQQRFVREAQAAGILNHPAIVTVHDIGTDTESGTSFIAMEFVEGPTLKEIMQQGKIVPYDQIAEIVAQVADALDYAHSKGIIHRDVKPANILLCADDRTKITDFGIAKIASQVSNLTTTGQFIGTPNYMAPEQVKGTAVDGRSDLFSLGIVLYETLTRRKPFGGDSLTTISYKIVHEDYPQLREINPEIPEGFEEVVKRCLAKDPAQRFQRGRELAAALRQIFRPVSTMTRAPDKFLTEPTMIGREAKPETPTVEVPFPQAERAFPAQSDGPLTTAATPVPFIDSPHDASGDITPRPSKTNPAARPVVVKRVHQPLGRVVWRTLRWKVPVPLFFVVVAIVFIWFGIKAMNIWNQRVPVPEVDVARERAVAAQKALRIAAIDSLKKGNVEGAYEKFTELQHVAPRSPFVASVLKKLDAIRAQQQVSRQALVDAQAKFEEGKVLFDKKDFAGAIDKFEEAFYLNPKNTEVVNYLTMAREQLSLRDMQQRNGGSSASSTRTAAPPPTRKSTVAEVTRQLNAPPSALQLQLKSPVADGTVVVRVDGQVIVNEPLWEGGKGFLRRKTARSVNVTHQLPPVSSEVDVAVSIPTLGINERKVYRQTFRSNVVHQLNIGIVPQSKQVTIELH